MQANQWPPAHTNAYAHIKQPQLVWKPPCANEGSVRIWRMCGQIKNKDWAVIGEYSYEGERCTAQRTVAEPIKWNNLKKINTLYRKAWIQAPTDIKWLDEIMSASVVASQYQRRYAFSLKKKKGKKISKPRLAESTGWVHGYYFPLGKFVNTERADS